MIAAWQRDENDEYQLGSSESYNMFELAELFEWHYVLIPERLGDRIESTIDLDETYAKLNWKPQYKLENWIKENYNE